MTSDVRGTKILVGHPVKTYPVGRVCALPGCLSILSRYNSDRFCSSHGVDQSTVVVVVDNIKKCTCCGMYKQDDDSHFYLSHNSKRLLTIYKTCTNKRRSDAKRAKRAREQRDGAV